MSKNVVFGTEEGKLFSYHLEEVETDLDEKGRSNEFIESIRDFWDKNDFVTEKQAQGVERFYERLG